MAAGEELGVGGTAVWNKETTEELIRLYEEREILYNVAHKDYHDREMRKGAMEEIAAVLGTTEEEIMKKMKSLRAQYGREKQRKSTSASGTVYHSKWHFLHLLTFLDRHMKVKVELKPVKQELEPDMEDVDAVMNDGVANGHHENDAVAMTSPPLVPTRRNKRRAPSVANFNKRLFNKRLKKSPLRSFQRSTPNFQDEDEAAAEPYRISGQQPLFEDADDIFGKHVAAEIRSISDPQSKRYAKLCIQNILYEAQSGVTSAPLTSASQPMFPSRDSLQDRYSSVYTASPSP